MFKHKHSFYLSRHSLRLTPIRVLIFYIININYSHCIPSLSLTRTPPIKPLGSLIYW